MVLPADFVSMLNAPNLTEFQRIAFLEEDPALFRLAMSVVLQVRDWMPAELGGLRSGYQSAISAHEAAPCNSLPVSKAPGPKRAQAKRNAAQRDVQADLVPVLSSQV